MGVAAEGAENDRDLFLSCPLDQIKMAEIKPSQFIIRAMCVQVVVFVIAAQWPLAQGVWIIFAGSLILAGVAVIPALIRSRKPENNHWMTLTRGG